MLPRGIICRQLARWWTALQAMGTKPFRCYNTRLLQPGFPQGRRTLSRGLTSQWRRRVQPISRRCRRPISCAYRCQRLTTAVFSSTRQMLSVSPLKPIQVTRGIQITFDYRTIHSTRFNFHLNWLISHKLFISPAYFQQADLVNLGHFSGWLRPIIICWIYF